MPNTNKVRWGVIGATSRIANSAMLPAIAQCPCSELAAVASRNRDSAAEIAVRYGPHVQVYGDYDSLLADPNVEVVYIPLPNNMHLGWAVEAMNNGKHVLCEQPLALNATEAQEMVETAQANGVLLSEAFMYRYHPLQQEVAAIVRRGDLGQISLVRASFSFVQTDAGDYRCSPGMGGGALLDVGCYCVHIARRAFGREPVAATAQWLINPTTQVDTTTTAHLEFNDHAMALLDCSFAMDFRATYEIVGSLGSLIVPQFFALGEKPGKYTLTISGGEPQTHQVRAGSMYAAEVEAMSRKVRGEDVFLLPAKDGLYNMRVLDAIAASARTGQKTAVVPQDPDSR